MGAAAGSAQQHHLKAKVAVLDIGAEPSRAQPPARAKQASAMRMAAALHCDCREPIRNCDRHADDFLAKILMVFLTVFRLFSQNYSMKSMEVDLVPPTSQPRY
jgi:hypothetical protein